MSDDDTLADGALSAWHEQMSTDLAPIDDYPSDVDLLATLGPQTLALDWQRTDLAFCRVQMERAVVYAASRTRADQMRVTSRAAVILGARWDSPDAEKIMGVRCVTDVYRGQRVGCRLCNTAFVAGIEDDYYEATSLTDGLCFGCVLLDTRTDAAQPELVGAVVAKRSPDPVASPARTAAAHTPSRRRPRANRPNRSET